MAFKIGFSATRNEKNSSEMTCIKQHTERGRRSVVQVYFEERRMTLAYYNDRFDLHRGDIVYVEGKLEGMRGFITEVNHNFKIKLSDYKRVIAVVDTSVHGRFLMAGSHFVTFAREAIPREKIVGWFKAPAKDDDEFVSGIDNEVTFPLSSLNDMDISATIATRGREYYLDNKVKYISIDGTKGYAIVEGSESYEVEFEYRNGDISRLLCSCFCGYNCKHEFAAMLQLKETLRLIEKNYIDEYERSGYFAAITKGALFEFAIDNKISGSFTL